MVFLFSKPPPKRTVAHTELTHSGQKVHIPGNDDFISDLEQFQPSDIPGLNKGEYSKLLVLLQRAHLPDMTAACPFLASTNFAGKLSHTCLLTKIDKTIWIIDSRASDHMTSDLSLSSF